LFIFNKLENRSRQEDMEFVNCSIKNRESQTDRNTVFLRLKHLLKRLRAPQNFSS
jgi:hypothetical protein